MSAGHWFRQKSRRGIAALVFFAACAGAVVPCQAVEEDGDLEAVRDPDYAAGRKAAAAQDWNTAIKFYSAAALRDPGNADIQNSLGYAHRKAGRLEAAFKHYRRALEINPRHRGAHEYIGEAYLMAGDLASAQKHLEALRKICLLPCEELADLEREIVAYQKRSAGERPR